MCMDTRSVSFFVSVPVHDTFPQTSLHHAILAENLKKVQKHHNSSEGFEGSDGPPDSFLTPLACGWLKICISSVSSTLTQVTPLAMRLSWNLTAQEY